jgi:translation elongation factor P/translation initiation factor 5A
MKKALFNLSVDGVAYNKGQLYTVEEVAHIDQGNFEDVDAPAVDETETTTEETIETTTDAVETNNENEVEVKTEETTETTTVENVENTSTVSTDSIYTITNKETGETIKVRAHTFGNDTVDFASADLTEEEWMGADVVLYTFANPNASGELSSEIYDIALDAPAVDETIQA